MERGLIRASTRSPYFFADLRPCVQGASVVNEDSGHHISTTTKTTTSRYDTIWYDSVYLTCSKNLTCSQLSPPHRHDLLKQSSHVSVYLILWNNNELRQCSCIVGSATAALRPNTLVVRWGAIPRFEPQAPHASHGAKKPRGRGRE